MSIQSFKRASITVNDTNSNRYENFLAGNTAPSMTTTFFYIYANIGITPTPNGVSTEYIYGNVTG